MLLVSSSDKITEMLEGLEAERNQIKKHIKDICWFSQGSVNYSDALIMSPEDRDAWVKYINDKLEESSGREFMKQESY